MRNTLPIILLLFASIIALAKQSPGGEEVNPFANKRVTSIYPEDVISMPTTTEHIVLYLQKQLPHLSVDGVTLKLVAHTTSPGGEHFTFEQVYHNVPVFNSQVKVNVGASGKVYSIFDNSYSSKIWSSASLISAAAELDKLPLAERLAMITGYTQASIEEHTVIAEIAGKPAAYKWLQLYDATSGDFRLYLLDKNAAIVYNHDLNIYAGVPATAYVFNPDPLTSAQRTYGPPYVDSSDANTLVLRNERKLVNIDVKLVSGMYYLENDHFIMSDFSSPNQTVVSSATPTFLYNRSESEFEEVNAYYHLNVFQAYVASLGYNNLTQLQIKVDAHALGGSDNSQFSSGGGFPRLSFGDGGIDDAEDADVIIHEYGHALSSEGSPGSNFGQERSALDEGFGDYFAASYSRSISSYRWNYIFSWDGNNEYWIGRDATTSKVYPGDLASSIHRNGEMWATALMQVWSALGQNVADKLALQTLSMLASNMSFTDAALAYIQADNALYGGANYNIIHAIMVERGFLSDTSVDKVSQTDLPAFELRNSYGFTFNGESAMLINHTNEPFNLTVYDISGKAVSTLENLNGNTQYLSGEQLAPGTYLIKVTAGNATQTFKLIK